MAVPVLEDEDVCHGAVGVIFTDGQRAQQLQHLTEASIALRGRIEDRFDSAWTGERSFATAKHSWIGESSQFSVPPGITLPRPVCG